MAIDDIHYVVKLQVVFEAKTEEHMVTLNEDDFVSPDMGITEGEIYEAACDQFRAQVKDKARADLALAEWTLFIEEECPGCGGLGVDCARCSDGIILVACESQ